MEGGHVEQEEEGGYRGPLGGADVYRGWGPLGTRKTRVQLRSPRRVETQETSSEGIPLSLSVTCVHVPATVHRSRQCRISYT